VIRAVLFAKRERKRLGEALYAIPKSSAVPVHVALPFTQSVWRTGCGSIQMNAPFVPFVSYTIRWRR